MDEHDLAAILRRSDVDRAALDIAAAERDRLAERAQPAQRTVGFLGRAGLRKIRDELLIPLRGFVALADEFLVHAQLEQGFGRVGALRILADECLQDRSAIFPAACRRRRPGRAD